MSAFTGLPVVMVLDRAGITGDDGPSHHGVLDMALALSIPGMTVFAPSSAAEVEVMLTEALTLDGPSVIRFPKTPAPWVAPGTVGSGLHARRTRTGDGSVCILAVGKMLMRRRVGRRRIRRRGDRVTVWDVRVVSEPDPAMLDDAARHRLVITAEDGIRQGGAGMFVADALAHGSRGRRRRPSGHCTRDAAFVHRPGQARSHPRRARARRTRVGPLGPGSVGGHRRGAPRERPGPPVGAPSGHRDHQRRARLNPWSAMSMGRGRGRWLPPEWKRVLLTAR